jgi:integrase
VRLERREGELRVPLAVDEVRVLADGIAPELRAAVVLAATAGLRQGELFGITDDRVAWLRRGVFVDRQLLTPTSGRPGLGPCKTPRNVRTVPVPDHVVAELAAHVERFEAGEGG